MLTTEEHKRILSTVSLFIETDDITLGKLADIVVEEAFPAGTRIFERDDHGECLYIVVDGNVRIEDDGRLLNLLGPRDVFGEMALLDAGPRTAAAIADTDTHLMRLDQEPFYDLMETHFEVARGIIRLLVGRLRQRVHDLHEDYVYMQAMATVTSSAIALENNKFESDMLESVTKRTDALGNLARVFQKMGSEVQNRERALKAQVQELRIQIDESKKAKEVQQIVESEYFNDLQAKLKAMKTRSK